MKKLLSVVLAVIMVMGMFAIPTAVAADTITVDSGWNGSSASVPPGTGTEEDPYRVSSADHLQWMSNLLTGKQYLATFGYNGQLWHPEYTDGWEEIEAYGRGTTSFTVNGQTVNIDGVPKSIELSDMSDAPKVYFVQTCDIDLNGKNLETIGAYWRYDGNGTSCVKGQWFGGTYDGQGYSIKNGYITPGGTSSSYWNSTGLFGNLWGATIKNLSFDNVHVKGHIDMGMVGGKVVSPDSFKNELDLATCFENQRTVIENVQVKYSCTVTHTAHDNMKTVKSFVGGLVGNTTYNTTFIRCRNGADISFGMYAIGVGGMTGKMLKNSRVELCVNTGDLIPSGGALPDQAAYGGIVGTWESPGNVYFGKNAVINCLNEGTLKKSPAAITGDSGKVISYGGIVGRTLTLASAKNADGEATEWTFENNINLGASPTLHADNSGYAKPRAAAGVGSLWNGDSQYDPANGLEGSHVVLVAKNCYTVNTFSGLAGYALRPSAACPILCSQIKSGSVYCGRAENCYSLSRDEIEALPLYKTITSAVGSSSAPHKMLGVQTKTESDETLTLRFICGIDSLEYKYYTLTVTASSDNKQNTEVLTDTSVYTGFLADGKEIKASDYGYEYLTMLTVKGIAKDKEYNIGVTSSALPLNYSNTQVNGDPCALNIKNGNITALDLNGHSVKIDGTDISEFVIVLPADASMAEKNVADVLYDHLYLSTGNKLNIVTDASAAASHEIRIGNTSRATEPTLSAAQYAVVPSGGHLQISFADSIALTALLDDLKDRYFCVEANDINLTLNGDIVMIQPDHPTLGTISASKIETVDADRYALRTLYVLEDDVSSKLKVLGRSTETSTGITMDWSAATVEFNADCEGDIKVGINSSRAIRFIVYVDDILTNTVVTGAGTSTYTIVTGLKAGNHNIRLVRTTKVEYSNVGALAELQSITIGGSLKERPANEKYLIEFVGDSVTAGVGAGSNTDPEAYAEHTYAYQTAQALGTDLSVVAIPGIGTLSSTGRHNGLTIYEAYQYGNYYRSTSEKYTPERQADLVVFATNANDNATPDKATFKARVKAMVDQAIAFHGEDTKFVWVFNMYANKNTINGYVREVFEEYGGESAGFYTLDFYKDNSGGDVHPSGAAHDDYTELLVGLIEEKNILN